jgi:hypothetical protein
MSVADRIAYLDRLWARRNDGAVCFHLSQSRAYRNMWVAGAFALRS